MATGVGAARFYSRYGNPTVAGFEDAIAQLVALAVLMPIVASTGGIAGTQSLAVAVRALATRDLNRSTAPRVIRRELIAGVLNGLGLALILGLVGMLVAVSTALVGPVAFFGLLVAGLAHGLAPSARHAVLLPAAGLIGAAILVVGQTLFERLMGQTATLSVVVEFAGGLFFLFLLLKGRVR